jgi:hypothetical protein
MNVAVEHLLFMGTKKVHTTLIWTWWRSGEKMGFGPKQDYLEAKIGQQLISYSIQLKTPTHNTFQHIPEVPTLIQEPPQQITISKLEQKNPKTPRQMKLLRYTELWTDSLNFSLILFSLIRH